MAMDTKPGDACMPKEEVSQDQELSGNVKEEDIKVNNEALNMENEIKTFEKSLKDIEVKDETESSYNDNENPNKSKEKKCENSSTNDKNRGEGFLKNCALLDLNEHEKNALAEMRSKLEEAISTNKLFEGLKKEVKEEHDDQSKTNDEKQNNKEGELRLEIVGKSNVENEQIQEIEYDKDISIWGVPLLPSKGDERTDVILEKFLKAREFKANDAFEMFRNTIWWRKQNKIDSILEEDFGGDYDSVAYISGFDLEGHPVCYNVYGVFGDAELYNKTFGTEESRQRFLRWRLQMMEKQIQKLNFKPGGVSSLLQINDLENTPGPARKDLRIAMKQAVGTLQENYPEFVHRNIFINVPFWYYAFNALLSPFLAPRTKSKFVFIRPARVTETLLKYVPAAEIPLRYGGLKREKDPDFSIKDGSSDVIVKGGSIEAIEIPAPEKGCNLIWDVTVIGWEVNYKEEFVPENEGSYTIIIQKERRMGWQEESVRNSFKNNEPGKVVLTVENSSFKKKRVLYRYKTIEGSTSSSQHSL
ncbi:hypothetical protein LIER_00492 [Lithospermum erythrorhizon]|uniref:Patellin-4 n=1 Tax=Lithospermum erythrorhizon TaxID=34254 RepID=A0AAV3NM95_LITER